MNSKIANLIEKLRNLRSFIVAPWRRRFYTWLVVAQAAHVKGKLKVNAKSRVNSRTTIGYNVHFNGMEIRGSGHCDIGNNFRSGANCKMLTHDHDWFYGDSLPYGQGYLKKDIRIEDNVWIGMNVIILGGVTIHEGAIIQAGSVVVRDIPPLAIAGGHPCEVFMYRPKNKYNTLKKNGAFV